jgi:pimeloyl-ACP methyl ester carboxylesterase
MARVSGAGGVSLAVETAGEGEPVLLVHGFPDSSRGWRHQLRPLVESGRRVIVPDLRGMGNSDRPQEVDAYRMRTLVADMLAVLDAFEVERAHVVGHDWGAGIAWVLAAMVPDRVASLAALSVAHPMASRPPSLEDRQKAWYTLYFLFPEAEELLLRDDAAMLRAWLGEVADGDHYLADLLRPGALTAGLNYYRANVGPARELRRRAELPPVAAPTLGLWSDGDIYLAEDAMRRSGEWVTGPWRYERVENATHFMQVDQPDLVTRLLLEHLDAHATPGRG